MIFSTVRLDVVHNDDSDRLSQFLSSLQDVKYVVYREIGDKTKKLHLQGYIQFNDMDSYDHAHDQFKEVFGKTHNRFQRSFTIVRKREKYMIYVSKDKNLEFQSGYTEEELKEKENLSYKKADKPQTFMEKVEVWWNTVKPSYELKIIELKINDHDQFPNPKISKVYFDLRCDLKDQFNFLKKTWDLPILDRHCNYLLSQIIDNRKFMNFLLSGSHRDQHY